ncbi:MAG: hypothetical protein L0K86_23100 [Actinomycetia bacterium]|nr:hypothetical protein [Actinomycetes bacterium]
MSAGRDGAMEEQYFGSAELRVAPDAIPAVRAAMMTTLEELADPIRKLRDGGYMTEPWLHDPVSVSVMNAYNTYVIDAPDGMRAAVFAYRDQLAAAIDALTEAERRYQAHEDDLTELVVRWT